MLDKSTAEYIREKLLPLLGDDLLIVNPMGEIIAGDSGDVNLLAEQDIVPLQAGRITIGYVLPSPSFGRTDEFIGFIQTIAALTIQVSRSEVSNVTDKPNVGLSEDESKTLSALMDCDLNLTKSSDSLKLHRNTLTYRLDKIEQKTGLDPRVFKDAIKLEKIISGRTTIKPIDLGDSFISDKILSDTLRAFLESNLDTNETAEKMNIHRNTLSYRLDKIRRLTGLDPHSFIGAATLKVSL